MSRVVFDDAKSVVSNLTAAFTNTNNIFLTVPQVRCSYNGKTIMDFGGYRVYSLNCSSGASISNDEVKQQSFCWVYESKHITNQAQRREFLFEKIKHNFPNHNVNVFVYNPSDSLDYYFTKSKGMAFFDRTYGDAVLIVLM